MPNRQQLQSGEFLPPTTILKTNDSTTGNYEKGNGVDVSLRHEEERFRGELNFFYYDFNDFVFPFATGEVEVRVPAGRRAERVRDHLVGVLRLVDLTSAGPARIFNIARKGRLAVGFDADFAVVDADAKWTITDDWIASRAAWTPYHDVTVQGRPIHTIVGGHFAVRDGVLADPGLGCPVRFLETL